MKELSIKEKAEAYDRALEKARQLCVYPTTKPFISDLQDLFPELKESESEDERIRKALICHISKISTEIPVGALHRINGVDIPDILAWLENQIENNNPLYIRFGDVPKDEKSKVYNGEIEIGTEKGVSVYPAFEDLEGNIVLGLSLPITKTSLYTQQHLLEYDTRPCYLVSGDYVGKGTDGEPLLRNVKIIREIKNFRVKQGEQKPAFEMKSAEESLGIDSETYNKIVDECIYGDDEQNPVNKVEPKFKAGNWYQCTKDFFGKGVTFDKNTAYYCAQEGCLQNEYGCHIAIVKDLYDNFKLWTIQDAKDGDVLAEDSCIFIIKEMNPNGTAKVYCCLFDDGESNLTSSTLRFDVDSTHPATKEQQDTLFAKMKEAGYEWDAEKKELKKIEQKPATIDIDKMVNDYANNKERGNEEFGKPVPCMIRAYRQGLNDAIGKVVLKPSWSEEDEEYLQRAIKATKEVYPITSDWLKSLKQRIKL